MDATYEKACANSKKMRKRVAHEQALWYEEELNKEIEKDRLAHGKKPLKKKDDNQPLASGGTGNDKISKLNLRMVVADAGYKTPAIAHRLLEDGIQPLFPYTRPKTKEGFFGKHEFA